MWGVHVLNYWPCISQLGAGAGKVNNGAASANAHAKCRWLHVASNMYKEIVGRDKEKMQLSSAAH